jgi:hypothetical protein
MANRVTPVQAAKDLGIRPQQVYGFIKHGRLGTFPNTTGKAALVDFDEVKRLVQSVKPHRPKGPDGKPVKRQPGVKVGNLLTSHGYLKGSRKRGPHRVEVVTGTIKDEEGDVQLVITQTGENTRPMYWEAERLADRLKNGACQVESSGVLLGVLIAAFDVDGRKDLAGGLRMWCEVNHVDVEEISPVSPQPVQE